MVVLKYNVLVVGLLALLWHPVKAQDGTITVKGGSDIAKAIPFENRYIYKEFLEGKVYFKNGKTSFARLNYSTLFAQVQFISPARDTLLLANIDYIDTIAIGKDVYYYLRGYGHIQRIGGAGKMLLGKIYSLANLGTEKAVSYGQYSQTSSVDGYSSYTDKDGRVRSLVTNDKTILKAKTRFFWIDGNKRITLATKNNLMRIFPKQKKILGDFIEQNNIDFANEQDLSRLLAYTASVQTQ